MNEQELRQIRRLCVYRCKKCGYINFKGFDIRFSKTPVGCKNCGEYLDSEDDKIGDSYHVEDFPEVAFQIEGKTSWGDPQIIAYFHTECRDCHTMQYIPWRNGKLGYDECECHKAKLPPAVATRAKEIEKMIAASVTVSLEFDASPKLLAAIKDWCFDKDDTKASLVILALEDFLQKEGYDV